MQIFKTNQKLNNSRYVVASIRPLYHFIASWARTPTIFNSQSEKCLAIFVWRAGTFVLCKSAQNTGHRATRTSSQIVDDESGGNWQLAMKLCTINFYRMVDLLPSLKVVLYRCEL
jgi:hypothetical protein